MDLRFKIIADHIPDGWQKSQVAVNDLRSRFRAFFGGVKAGTAAMVSGIAAGIAAVVAVFRNMRNQAIAEFNEMEDRGVRYAQTLETAIRKVKMASSEQMKLRIVEDIRQEIQALQSELAKAQFDDASKDIFAQSGENFRAIVSGLFGMGFQTQDERVQSRIAAQIKQLQMLQKTAESKDVSKFGEEEIAAAQFERMSAKELQAAKTPQEREAVLARRVEMARFAEEDARAALAERPGDEDLTKRVIDSINALAKAEEELFQASEAAVASVRDAELKAFKEMAEQAEKIAEQKEREAKAVASVRDAMNEQAKQDASPVERRAMQERELADLRAKFYAKDGLGNFQLSTEDRADVAKKAIGIQSAMKDEERKAREAIEAEQKRKADEIKSRAGQSLSVADIFTRAYGQEIDKSPEREQADSLKEAVNLLKSIDKKSGAAP